MDGREPPLLRRALIICIRCWSWAAGDELLDDGREPLVDGRPDDDVLERLVDGLPA